MHVQRAHPGETNERHTLRAQISADPDSKYSCEKPAASLTTFAPRKFELHGPCITRAVCYSRHNPVARTASDDSTSMNSRQLLSYEIGELVHASRQHAKHFASDTGDSSCLWSPANRNGRPSRGVSRSLFASDTFVALSVARNRSTKFVDSIRPLDTKWQVGAVMLGD